MKSEIVSFLVFMFLGSLLFIQPVAAFDGDDVSLSPTFISTCPIRTLSEDDISYFVTNSGPTTDTFFLSIDWTPGLSFIQPQVVLASGEQEKVEALWITIPYDMEPGSHIATITARSALTSEEVSKTIEINVLTCHVVELDVNPLERTQQICMEQSNPAEYTLEITNRGMDTETFDLSTSAPWATLDRGSVTLDSGEAETFTLTAEPPGSVQGFQVIMVDAESTSSFAFASVDVFLDIVDCYSYTTSLQPSSATSCLGRDADYTLLISNTGLADDFDIIAPSGVSLESDSISLDFNEGGQIGVTVTPASTGTNEFEITVQSRADVGNVQTVTGTVTGEECKGVSVIISPASDSVCQGETVDYMVNVRNTGSLADSFDLTTSQGTLGQSGVNLDPDESMDIPLTVDTINLAGTVTIEVEASNDAVEDMTSATLTTRNCYQGALTIVPTAASACPFTDADFDITLENTGELEDMYEISFGNTITTATLDAGESKVFDLTFPVTITDESSLVINVTAVSQGRRQELVASSTLTVKSEESCYAVSLSNGEAESVRVNKATAVPLKLKNMGEQPGVFTVTVQGPDYVYVEPTSIQLGFNEEKEVYLYVSPPFGIEAESVIATISALSERTQTALDVAIDVLPENGEAVVTIPAPSGNGHEEPTTPEENQSISLNVSLGEGEGEEIVVTPPLTGIISGDNVTGGIAPIHRAIVVAVITIIIIVVLVARFAFLFS